MLNYPLDVFLWLLYVAVCFSFITPEEAVILYEKWESV